MGEVEHSMFQARIHGRGGQGVVTHAELLTAAAFVEGTDAQAFPTFGSALPVPPDDQGSLDASVEGVLANRG